MMDEAPGKGDLFVAINDVRTRSQAGMDQAMAKLKPDDVFCLTVVRPVNAFKHDTLKFLVQYGGLKKTGDCR